LINPVTASVEADPTGTLATIIEHNSLKVGMDPTYPPFEEINAVTDEYEGFDVDLAQIIADEINVTLTIVTSDWTPIIPNLQASQFDMIISAMTITDARELEVDFSRWYYQSYQAILVPVANPHNILSETDLDNASLIIGLQLGTTSHIWVNETLTEDVTINPYDTIILAIQALKNGQVDVVLGDYAVLALDELESAATKVVDTYSPENFGIAMRTGDTDLVEKVNGILNGILDGLLGNDPENPTPNTDYNDIYSEWFGVDAPDYTPPTDTTTTDTTSNQAFTFTSGFEFIALIITIAAIPVIRKNHQ